MQAGSACVHPRSRQNRLIRVHAHVVADGQSTAAPEREPNFGGEDLRCGRVCVYDQRHTRNRVLAELAGQEVVMPKLNDWWFVTGLNETNL